MNSKQRIYYGICDGVNYFVCLKQTGEYLRIPENLLHGEFVLSSVSVRRDNKGIFQQRRKSDEEIKNFILSKGLKKDIIAFFGRGLQRKDYYWVYEINGRRNSIFPLKKARKRIENLVIVASLDNSPIINLLNSEGVFL